MKKFGSVEKSLYLCTRKTSNEVKHNNNNAKIAQLVEHDLAKVGVAGSSPVFRSSSGNPE